MKKCTLVLHCLHCLEILKEGHHKSPIKVKIITITHQSHRTTIIMVHSKHLHRVRVSFVQIAYGCNAALPKQAVIMTTDEDVKMDDQCCTRYYSQAVCVPINFVSVLFL